MKRFGVDEDAVICVERGECRCHEPSLIFRQETESFDCGFFELDKFTGLIYLENEDPSPVSPADVLSVGKILGCCRLEDLNDSPVYFKKLPHE